MDAVHDRPTEKIPARRYPVHMQGIIVSGKLFERDLICECKFTVGHHYRPGADPCV
jgi:hypothetical protein